MKNIKKYNISKNYSKTIVLKIVFFSFSLLIFILFFNIFNISYKQVSTDIVWKISNSDLISKKKELTFDGTVWPIKEITDLSSNTIKRSSMNYSQVRSKNRSEIPLSMRRDFPFKFADYIKKYKNITLFEWWKIFKDPAELDKFIFIRRILRATWTSDYSSKKIWIKWSWTHAWIDIIWNTWTPVYSLANWLVVKKEKSNKWFGNYIGILHKIENNYYLSFYAHLSSLNSEYDVWEIISKWNKVWTIWNSWNSNWSHLHLQINKVFTLQDIINWKIMIWWYHNLAWVKAYTVDPIKFIEKYYESWDDFKNIVNSKNPNFSYDKQENIKQTEKENTDNSKKDDLDSKEGLDSKENKQEKDDTADLVEQIAKELDKKTKSWEHSSADEKKVFIDEIEMSLINEKIQVWHSFNINIKFKETWKWFVWIVASNDNLIFSRDTIEDPSKKEYNINVVAKNLWSTKISINDWNKTYNYNVKIYNKDSEKIYWITIQTQDLNFLTKAEFKAYPINKLWQKLNKKLRWEFKLYLEKNKDKEFIKNLNIDNFEYVWNFKNIFIGEGNLILENDKYYSKINIEVDIAKDYKNNQKYANNMLEIIKKWIVNWEKWFLYPNRQLTRRELLTILSRGVLNINYERADNDMKKYMKNNGKFFDDIDWTAYSDPYVYIAWKKWIIKWENNKSLANNYVSKWELLTILTRLFELEIKNDTLNSWTDLKNSTNLKKIADTTKKYWLYPFKNYNSNKFNPWEFVSRLKSFESLARFLSFNGNLHTSANEEELEDTFNEIFEF